MQAEQRRDLQRQDEFTSRDRQEVLVLRLRLLTHRDFAQGPLPPLAIFGGNDVEQRLVFGNEVARVPGVIRRPEYAFGRIVEGEHAAGLIDHDDPDRRLIDHAFVVTGQGQQALVQFGILDRQRRLLGKQFEQAQITLPEQTGTRLVVEIADADDRVFDLQRHTDDKAEAQFRDRFLVRVARVLLRVRRVLRDARCGNTVGDRTGNVEVFLGVERFLADVVRDTELQASLLIQQHQEPALGVEQIDGMTHDPAQDLIQHERRIDRLGNVEQRLQVLHLDRPVLRILVARLGIVTFRCRHRTRVGQSVEDRCLRRRVHGRLPVRCWLGFCVM